MPNDSNDFPQLVTSASNERRIDSKRVFFTDSRSTQTDPPRRFPFTNTSMLVDHTTAAISSNGNRGSSRNVYASRPSSKGDMRIVSAWAHRRRRRALQAYQRHGCIRPNRHPSQCSINDNSPVSTDRRAGAAAAARTLGGMNRARARGRQQQNNQRTVKQQSSKNVTFVSSSPELNAGSIPSKVDVPKLKGLIGSKRILGANKICFGQDPTEPRDPSTITKGSINATDRSVTVPSDIIMISRATQTSSLSCISSGSM
ncbi:uncharacterized protein LOC111262778 [Varroa jacobsoni]|uniref:Uncharacterized protein n=1 Tax=Varroa destructor TaxID=109461 RepID=A0A7M7KQA3_VARDE|nr:uncharacterized protein LOC111252855 [Varroa destructor]XP_022693033.1 uncharacterized protein LOC111262778 [Varroa jacobsoni]